MYNRGLGDARREALHNLLGVRLVLHSGYRNNRVLRSDLSNSRPKHQSDAHRPSHYERRRRRRRRNVFAGALRYRTHHVGHIDRRNQPKDHAESAIAAQTLSELGVDVRDRRERPAVAAATCAHRLERFERSRRLRRALRVGGVEGGDVGVSDSSGCAATEDRLQLLAHSERRESGRRIRKSGRGSSAVRGAEAAASAQSLRATVAELLRQRVSAARFAGVGFGRAVTSRFDANQRTLPNAQPLSTH